MAGKIFSTKEMGVAMSILIKELYRHSQNNKEKANIHTFQIKWHKFLPNDNRVLSQREWSSLMGELEYSFKRTYGVHVLLNETLSSTRGFIEIGYENSDIHKLKELVKN